MMESKFTRHFTLGAMTGALILLVSAGCSSGVLGSKACADLQSVIADGTLDEIDPAGYMTILNQAVDDGDYSCAERILQAGADPNMVSEVGVDNLQFAILATRPDIIRLLIDHGAAPLDRFDLRGLRQMAEAVGGSTKEIIYEEFPETYFD